MNDDALFEGAFIYKPLYLPSNMHIEVLSNTKYPSLPWCFRWKSSSSICTLRDDEPINFKDKRLSKIIFGVNDLENEFVKFFDTDFNIEFKLSSINNLHLVFENCNDTHTFKTLNLTISY